MHRFLLFVLAGPLASWGETSNGQHRPSADRPTKSAVLGMLAAARGVPRGDPEIPALGDALGYAVRVDRAGVLVSDYHTTHTPIGDPEQNRWRTRACELATNKINTSITAREYRADAVYTIALWSRDGRTDRLDQLATALRKPVWALYLGRKSCPLGIPLRPEIREAETLEEALHSDLPVHGLIWPTGRPGSGAIYHDTDAPGQASWVIERVAVDRPSATAWRAFQTRPERVAAEAGRPPRPEDFF